MVQGEVTLFRKTPVKLTALLQQNVTCQASNVKQPRIKTVKSGLCLPHSGPLTFHKGLVKTYVPLHAISPCDLL